jgi:hypothetical protein
MLQRLWAGAQEHAMLLYSMWDGSAEQVSWCGWCRLQGGMLVMYTHTLLAAGCDGAVSRVVFAPVMLLGVTGPVPKW